MGNKTPTKDDLPRYDWKIDGNVNGLDLYRRKDGVIAERRKIKLDHRFGIEEEKKIYKVRETNEFGFVKVYEVDGAEQEAKKKKSNFCECGQQTLLYVYSERIENRLSDLPQLNFAQSLSILWDTVNSFQKLYEEFGPFHINGQLIGMNTDHKVRVWLNQNWALNHPSHFISNLRTMANSEVPPELRNQSEMIHNLLQVIQEKNERGKFPNGFQKDVYANADSFRKIKRFLSHYMQNQYNNYVPDVVARKYNVAGYDKIKEEPNRIQHQDIQHVQSTYIPGDSSKPIFGNQHQGSNVVRPGSGYQSDNKSVGQRPIVTFHNSSRPAEDFKPYEPQRQVQNSRPIERPGQVLRPVQHRPVEFSRPVENRPVQFVRPAERPIEPMRPFEKISPADNNPPLYRPTAEPQRNGSGIKINYQQNHPGVTFNHNSRPLPVQQTSHLVSNPETHPQNFPKFHLVGENTSSAPTITSHPSPIPISNQPQADLSHPIDSSKADPALEQIRSMLKSDIEEMNSHKTQYKIVEKGGTHPSGIQPN